MRTLVALLAFFAGAGLRPLASLAAADPELPDLGDFAAVDPDAYRKYHVYGTTGWQFAEPGGILCRLSQGTKSWYLALRCWGPLPGLPGGENTAAVPAVSSMSDPLRPGVFSKTDQRGYGHSNDSIPGQNLPPRPMSAGDYPPLSPGQKIEVPENPHRMTCAAGDSGMLACQIECAEDGHQPWRHGFVISPRGSWTF
jgi:hypothetical protein